jgi:hypothetical protein
MVAAVRHPYEVSRLLPPHRGVQEGFRRGAKSTFYSGEFANYNIPAA